MNNEINKKDVPFWFTLSMFTLLFIFIGFLAYKNLREVSGGVNIEAKIDKDENTSSLFTLKGNAKHATFITINGREIYIQKNGDFKERIAMPDGYSVVTIFARNKFGKDVEKKIELYTPSDSRPLVVYEK